MAQYLYHDATISLQRKTNIITRFIDYKYTKKYTSKLTPQLKESILKDRNAGLTVKRLAANYNIHERTIYKVIAWHPTLHLSVPVPEYS